MEDQDEDVLLITDDEGEQMYRGEKGCFSSSYYKLVDKDGK